MLLREATDIESALKSILYDVAGTSVGSAVGAKVGGLLGMLVGPIGAYIGSTVGAASGAVLGRLATDALKKRPLNAAKERYDVALGRVGWAYAEAAQLREQSLKALIQELRATLPITWRSILWPTMADVTRDEVIRRIRASIQTVRGWIVPVREALKNGAYVEAGRIALEQQMGSRQLYSEVLVEAIEEAIQAFSALKWEMSKLGMVV